MILKGTPSGCDSQRGSLRFITLSGALAGQDPQSGSPRLCEAARGAPSGFIHHAQLPVTILPSWQRGKGAPYWCRESRVWVCLLGSLTSKLRSLTLDVAPSACDPQRGSLSSCFSKGLPHVLTIRGIPQVLTLKRGSLVIYIKLLIIFLKRGFLRFCEAEHVCSMLLSLYFPVTATPSGRSCCQTSKFINASEIPTE